MSNIQLITSHTGIGGPELAAESLGWNLISSCEINEDCQRVLNHYWPNTYHHNDIHTLTRKKIEEKTKWDKHKPTVYVVGFPCQPFSNAGRREGEKDDRYHWPVVRSFNKELGPDWIIIENVAGLKSMVFKPEVTQVERQALIEGENTYRTVVGEGILLRFCDDLESDGYTVQPYVIPAVGVEGSHIRYRVFIVAHRNLGREEYERQKVRAGWDTPEPGATGPDADTHGAAAGDTDTGADQSPTRAIWRAEEVDVPGQHADADSGGRGGDGGRTGRGPVADTSRKRAQSGRGKGTERHSGVIAEDSPELPYRPGRWGDLLREPPIFSGDDELSERLVGITLSQHREFSAISYGNAICPAQILPFFKAIQEIESMTNQ